MISRKKHSKPTKKKFVLIDSFNLIHRAYYAYPSELRSLDGTQVNVVFGFTSMLLRVLEELDPDFIACAFDTGKPTWRHAELVAYKKNRKKPDVEMLDQIPLVRRVIDSLNIPILEFSGFEADDVVGTVSSWVEEGRWKTKNIDLVIVSGDADILQLAGGSTRVWLPKKTFKDMVMYDDKEVIKKYGFPPDKVPDYKALVGDPSDNIPGVSGIGKITATDLIKKYGSVENIFKNIEKLDTRAKNKLSNQEEIAYLSKKIATIVNDVPIDVKIDDCKTIDFDLEEAVGLFTDLGFRTLIPKVKKIHEEEGYPGEPPVKINPKLSPADITKEKTSQFNMFEQPVKTKEISSSKKIKGMQLKIVDAKFLKKKLSKREEFALYYSAENVYLKSKLTRDILGFAVSDEACIKEIFNSKAIIWGYDLKDFFKITSRMIDEREIPYNILDLQVLAYLVVGDRRDYSFDSVVFEFLKEEISGAVQTNELEKAVLVLSKISELKDELLARINGMKFIKKEYAWDNFNEVKGPKEVTKTPLGKVFYYIDNPSVYVLAFIEQAGIVVNQKELAKKKSMFEKRLEKIEKEIYKSVGHEFKINSPKQLSDVLFEELSLPKTKRMKTGYSTDEESLEEIKDYHPLPKLIIEYREISKLLSTYIENLSNKVDTDGRVRTTYNHIGTSTGRLASVDPNLQNIPIRKEEGREIRKLFVAGPGNLFIKIDYSQIDLRVLADQTEDPMLIESFSKGYDIHARTAAMIFNKDVDKITKNERRIGKTVNFGISYGLSPFGLSRELDISHEDAAKYISSYFNTYPGVEEYMNETIQFVKDHQYVETMFGRRRYIYNIDSSNRAVQLAAQREAINMPIQGAATGDIMRLAMIRLFEVLEAKYEDYAKILLQVHDELLLEVSEKISLPRSKQKTVKLSKIDDKSKRLRPLINDVKKTMEGVVKMKIPLSVDIGIGFDWRDLVEIEI